MRAPLASWWVLTAMIGAGATGAHAEPPSEDEPDLSLVQVIVNGQALDAPVFVATYDDALYLPSNILGPGHPLTPSEVRRIQGQDFVPFAALGADQFDYDKAHDTLRIECSASCFDATSISAQPTRAAPLSPVAPGVFLNYDLYGQTGDLSTYGGALLEAGMFTGAGTGLSRFACTSSDEASDCIRLDTNWTIDTPSAARRLTIGDSITRAALWGTPVRFGGVSLGTDFSLIPEQITFPTPSISSEAALPGLVDVIINDARRFSTEVPAGPFTLSDLPVVTGAGSTQLVVTDVLGRETLVSADYYVAPQLLRPGLQEWSLEAGFLREDYGLRSNHYEDGFVAGSYAQGITNEITLGARSELGPSQQSAGIIGAFLNPAFGVFQTSAAMSHQDGTTGGLLDLSHEWRSSAFSLGGGLAFATDNFRQFGRERVSPRLTARTFASYADENIGALSFNWTHRDERDMADFSTLGIRYTRSIGTVSLNLSAIKIMGLSDTTVASISLSMPLGGGASSSAGVDYRDNRVAGDFRYQKTAPASGGLGYYGRVGVDGYERYDAGTDWRTRYGDAAAAFSQVDGRAAGRFSVRGGAAYVGDMLVLAPSITDSIAVVSVGDEPGVRVYQDRQLVGRTDKSGRVVLTRLRPFEPNRIAFDARDVSLTNEYRQTEAVLVPGLRTGHEISFESSHARSAIAYVVDQAGVPITQGGRIADVDSGRAYPIGMDGRIYLEGARPVTRLKYVRDKMICEAEIRLGPRNPDTPYDNAGTVPCLPVVSLR